MNIRIATHSDIAALSQLEQQCQPHPWSEQQLSQSLNAPNQIWVTEHQQHIIAMLAWQTIVDEIEIHLLNTHPQYRRQGYARQLLQCLFSRAQQQQIRRILLEVRAGNSSAQQLYMHHGFQQCGRRKHYYNDNEDALILEKTLC